MPRRPVRAGGARGPAFGRAVAAWFRSHRRTLPWRVSREPYRVWVAEVLLQQTRVEQAVPFFERFVDRFPDLKTLARARPAEVLKAWQGAGYYARARHLHAAARELLERHGGKVPSSPEELEQLPGIGPYSARAIAAIAFGVGVVPVDANGLRIAARWWREERPIDRTPVRARLAALLESCAPSGDAGAFAEGLMELGELVCRPHAPRCRECPIASGCRARRELADPGVLPRRGGRTVRPHVRGAVVALAHGGRWLVQRRPASGLLGGLWEFPGGKIEPGETAEAAARRELREETGATAGPLQPVGLVRHGYSHFSVELAVFRGAVRRLPGRSAGRRWATLTEVARLPLPRATEKILTALRSDLARKERGAGLRTGGGRRAGPFSSGEGRPGRPTPRGSRRRTPGPRTAGRG